MLTGEGRLEFAALSALGEGTFGTVHAARDLVTGREVAVKVLDSADTRPEIVRREEAALDAIRNAGGHPHVVEHVCTVHGARATTRLASANAAARREADARAGVLAGAVVALRRAVLRSAPVRSSSAMDGDDDEDEDEQPQSAPLAGDAETWLVLERVCGEDLFDAITRRGPLPEHEVARIAEQALSALAFLHARAKVAHGDLKPENMLLDASGSLKLCDFGSSVRVVDEDSKRLAPDAAGWQSVGSAAYSAPELLSAGRRGAAGASRARGGGELTTAIDVWSLGCALYAALSGTHPFDLDGALTDAQIVRAVRSQPVRFDGEEWEEVSAAARDLVCRMLEKEPAERISVGDAARHAFVVSASA